MPRHARQCEIARWIAAGDILKRDVVKRVMSEFGVQKTVAYEDYDEAARIAALDSINDQLVYGALALSAAMGAGMEARRLAKDMEQFLSSGDYTPARFTGLERVQKAEVRAGGLLVRVADTAFRLRPAEMMTSDEGKELLLRALEQSASTLSAEDCARLQLMARTRETRRDKGTTKH